MAATNNLFVPAEVTVQQGELEPLHEFLAVGIRSSYKGHAGVHVLHFSDWDEAPRAAGVPSPSFEGSPTREREA